MRLLFRFPCNSQLPNPLAKALGIPEQQQPGQPGGQAQPGQQQGGGGLPDESIQRIAKSVQQPG